MAMLMSEVLSLKGDSLMGTGYDSTSELPFKRTFLGFRELPLSPPETSLFFAEELGWGYSLPGGERGKRVKSNIYTNSFLVRTKPLWLTFTRERHIPLVSRRSSDGSCLGCAFELTMEDYLDMTYFGDNQSAILDATPYRHLREGHAVISIFPPKPGIANFLLLSPNPSEERFIGKINTLCYILQHLRMNTPQRWPLLLQEWYLPFGLEVCQRSLLFLIGTLAHVKNVVVKPLAFLELLVKYGSLLLSREYAVLE